MRPPHTGASGKDRMIGIVPLIGLFLATGAWAQDATFSTTLGSAILCLDDLSPGYFYNYMRRKQRPYKTEQGAYWFKTSERLFGAPITEVFISDGSSRYSFVGAVSSLSPSELAEAVSAGAPAGGGFRRLSRTDRYSIYVSPAGAQIAYQGNKGKIFCRQYRALLSN